MNEKEKLIFFAGLVEGEGHFSVINAKNGQGRLFIRPGIYITQSDITMLQWIKENIGGNFWTAKPVVHFGKPRILSQWSLGGKKAVEIAKKIEPFLITKKEQAKRLTRIKYDTHGYIVKETAYHWGISDIPTRTRKSVRVQTQ